jgi:hypothetical protein
MPEKKCSTVQASFQTEEPDREERLIREVDGFFG